MKAIILYYSNTGNTLLACKYLANKITSVDFDFYNILKNKSLSLNNYDIAGFATFTDTWDTPKIFIDFIDTLKKQKHKPSFLLNTYGFLSGKTLKTLNHKVSEKGFLVLCGHSLHTPENFPPMIRIGLGCANHPGKGDLKKFDAFIINLSQKMNNFKNNKEIIPEKIKIGIINTLLPSFPQGVIHPMMGDKKVDEELCTECRVCEKNCPGAAITLDPKPLFDDNKCHYCWACYNKCPQKAVYTTKYRGKYHYPRPNETLKEKLNGITPVRYPSGRYPACHLSACHISSVHSVCGQTGVLQIFFFPSRHF